MTERQDDFILRLGQYSTWLDTQEKSEKRLAAAFDAADPGREVEGILPSSVHGKAGLAYQFSKERLHELFPELGSKELPQREQMTEIADRITSGSIDELASNAHVERIGHGIIFLDVVEDPTEYVIRGMEDADVSFPTRLFSVQEEVGEYLPGDILMDLQRGLADRGFYLSNARFDILEAQERESRDGRSTLAADIHLLGYADVYRMKD